MTLKSYIATKILLAIPTVLILLTVVFLILHVIPGDPVNAIVGPSAPASFKAQVRHELGLDRPIYIQYFSYLLGIFSGNFGTSSVTGQPIASELAHFFPATVELTVAGMLVTLAIGIPLGLFSSTRPNSKADVSIRVYGIAIYAIPIFWLGLMFQLVFGVFLHVLPVSGMGTPPSHIYTGVFVLDSALDLDGQAFISDLTSLILPALTLGIILSGVISRVTRSYTIQNLGQQFSLAARSRGLKSRVILISYGFRNALIPMVTIIGLQVAVLLGGAALVETTFSWPGVGLYLVQRIPLRDYNAVQGGVVLFAIVVTAVNLVVDIIYALIDPRVKL